MYGIYPYINHKCVLTGIQREVERSAIWHNASLPTEVLCFFILHPLRILTTEIHP